MNNIKECADAILSVTKLVEKLGQNFEKAQAETKAQVEQLSAKLDQVSSDSGGESSADLHRLSEQIKALVVHTNYKDNKGLARAKKPLPVDKTKFTYKGELKEKAGTYHFKEGSRRFRDPRDQSTLIDLYDLFGPGVKINADAQEMLDRMVEIDSMNVLVIKVVKAKAKT